MVTSLLPSLFIASTCSAWVVFAVNLYLKNVQGDPCKTIFEHVCVLDCVAFICKQRTNGVPDDNSKAFVFRLLMRVKKDILLLQELREVVVRISIFTLDSYSTILASSCCICDWIGIVIYNGSESLY